jgi:hypothetical protein
LWDTKHLRKADFRYKWQAEENDLKGLGLGEIKAPGWQPVSGEQERYEYHDTIASEEAFPLPAPGIDQPMGDLYLSEGYALPEAECWGIVIFSAAPLDGEGPAHYPSATR